MMTTAEIDAMRAEHVDSKPFPGYCTECYERDVGGVAEWVAFPCVPARLLAELDRREAQHRWQGRDHLSPVPHLVEVQR